MTDVTAELAELRQMLVRHEKQLESLRSPRETAAAPAAKARSTAPADPPQADVDEGLDVTATGRFVAPVAYDPVSPSEHGWSPAAVARWMRNDMSVGLPDSHPLILSLDFLYLVSTFVSCIFVVTAVDPQTDDVQPGDPLFSLFIGWFTLDAVFLVVWTAVRFVAQQRGLGEFDIRDCLGEIRSHYLRSEFIIDGFVALPIDYLLAGISWEWFFFWKVRYFLRIPRSFLNRRRSNPLTRPRSWYDFVWLLLAFSWLVHVLATGFADIEGKDYLESLYFAVLSVTSVGYGDVVAETRAGRIFTIFLMLIGATVFSVVTAYATAFLTITDVITQKRRTRRAVVQQMFDQYHVPWRVQKDIIASFREVESVQNHTRDFAELVAAFPPTIRATISAFAYRAVLATSLSSFPDAAVHRLAELVAVRWVSRGSRLSTKGTVIATAHIVSQGSIVEEGGAVWGPGAAVALPAIVESGEPLRAPATVTAVQACELLVVTRDAFDTMVADEPVAHKAVRQLAAMPFIVAEEHKKLEGRPPGVSSPRHRTGVVAETVGLMNDDVEFGGFN